MRDVQPPPPPQLNDRTLSDYSFSGLLHVLTVLLRYWIAALVLFCAAVVWFLKPFEWNAGAFAVGHFVEIPGDPFVLFVLTWSLFVLLAAVRRGALRVGALLARWDVWSEDHPGLVATCWVTVFFAALWLVLPISLAIDVGQFLGLIDEPNASSGFQVDHLALFLFALLVPLVAEKERDAAGANAPWLAAVHNALHRGRNVDPGIPAMPPESRAVLGGLVEEYALLGERLSIYLSPPSARRLRSTRVPDQAALHNLIATHSGWQCTHHHASLRKADTPAEDDDRTEEERLTAIDAALARGIDHAEGTLAIRALRDFRRFEESVGLDAGKLFTPEFIRRAVDHYRYVLAGTTTTEANADGLAVRVPLLWIVHVMTGADSWQRTHNDSRRTYPFFMSMLGELPARSICRRYTAFDRGERPFAMGEVVADAIAVRFLRDLDDEGREALVASLENIRILVRVLSGDAAAQEQHTDELFARVAENFARSRGGAIDMLCSTSLSRHSVRHGRMALETMSRQIGAADPAARFTALLSIFDGLTADQREISQSIVRHGGGILVADTGHRLRRYEAFVRSVAPFFFKFSPDELGLLRFFHHSEDQHGTAAAFVSGAFTDVIPRPRLAQKLHAAAPALAWFTFRRARSIVDRASIAVPLEGIESSPAVLEWLMSGRKSDVVRDLLRVISKDRFAFLGEGTTDDEHDVWNDALFLSRAHAVSSLELHGIICRTKRLARRHRRGICSRVTLGAAMLLRATRTGEGKDLRFGLDCLYAARVLAINALGRTSAASHWLAAADYFLARSYDFHGHEVEAAKAFLDGFDLVGPQQPRGELNGVMWLRHPYTFDDRIAWLESWQPENRREATYRDWETWHLARELSRLEGYLRPAAVEHHAFHATVQQQRKRLALLRAARGDND